MSIFKNFKLIEVSILLCFILPPAGIFLLLMIGLHTLYKHWRDKKRFVLSVSSYFFMCLFISTIGAAILNREFYYLCTSLLILGYWGLYLRIVGSERYQLFLRFRFIMIFGGIYSCVIGWISKLYTFPPVVSYLMGTVLFANNEPRNYNRLIGCEYNPNFTVYILLIAISFLFAYLLDNLRNKRSKSLTWLLPLTILLSYGVVQTGSRAGFASMILIYFLFFFRLNRTFFIVCSIVGLSFSKWLLHVMPRADSVMHASQLRQDIWKNTITIWQNNPIFGVTPIGFGQEYLNRFNDYIPHAHNMLLGMFAEYGIIGGSAFLIVIGLNLTKVIHLFFAFRSKKCVLDSFLLGLPIILLTGVFDEPLFSPQIGLLTVILLSCWDWYTKRVHFVLAIPSITRINYWIYSRVLSNIFFIF